MNAPNWWQNQHADATSPNDGDVPTYDAAFDCWRPQAPTVASTNPLQPSTVTGSVGTDQTVAGGDSTDNDGGNLILDGGSGGADNNSGGVTLKTPSTTGLGSSGGIAITTGNTQGTTAGPIHINGGYAYGAGSGGSVTITAGGSQAGSEGSFTVQDYATSTKTIEAGPGATLGFYGAIPVAQQTGVAITADAIHAALVALGLITA